MAAAFAASGALAQNSVTPPAAPPASTSNQVIRPDGDLRNFDLQGRVTRPAQEQPAPPAATTSTPAPDQRPAAPPPGQTRRSEAPVAVTPVQRAQPAPAPVPSEPSPARAPSLEDFELPGSPATSSTVSTTAAPAPAGAAPVLPYAAPAADTELSQLSLLPWLLVALAALGAAAFFVWRRHARPALAGTAGNEFVIEAETLPSPPPPPVPAPQPAPPPPPPPPAAGTVGGVVSSKLRPWIDLQFQPDRVVVDESKVTLEFTLVIVNTGGAAARDVLVEAAMLNAGPSQDQQIAQFFANPVGQGEPIPMLAPFQRLEIRSSTALNLDQVQALEVEGRRLLIPMIALNGLYRWGGASRGQTSISRLVGKQQTNSDKLAPLRLDFGPRIFRGLASREHSMGVRR